MTKRPPVPPDLDLRDFRWMPLDVIALRNSSTWNMADGWQSRAAINLWVAAWHQVPAGSLPKEDAAVAGLAGIPAEHWPEAREIALRNFVECSDGRLYHLTICEWAMEQSGRIEHGKRAANIRWAKKKRHNARALPEQSPSIAPAVAGEERREDVLRSSEVSTSSERAGPVSETPLARVNDHPFSDARAVDPVKLVYDLGKSLLKAYDLGDQKAGALVTKWLKIVTAQRLTTIFIDARTQERHDIIAYISGAVGTNEAENEADAFLRERGINTG